VNQEKTEGAAVKHDAQHLPENPRPGLHRVPLHDAMAPGVRSVRIAEGQSLDALLVAGYEAGWALIETDGNGNALRAYRRELTKKRPR
jgi:hypothetical protein